MSWLGFAIRGVYLVKKRHNINDIIEALDVASISAGGLNRSPEEIKLSYLPKEKEKRKFDRYITTTGWLDAVGVNIHKEPYKMLFFGAIDEKGGMHEGHAGEIYNNLAAREDNLGRNIYVFDLDGNPDLLLCAIEASEGKIKRFVQVYILKALEESKLPQSIGNMIGITKELYSLDRSDPTNALRLYMEKHSMS